MPDFSAAGPSPIEGIRLVARFEVRDPAHVFTATSLPGHLIHLIAAGEVEQTSNGRQQRLTPGTAVWYHEDEWVEGRVKQVPWVCYSVNFHAPALSPPDFAQRLLSNREGLAPVFTALLEAWKLPPSWRRDCLCQSHLLALIAGLDAHGDARPPTTSAGRLWWEVETWARRQIDRALTLDELCAQFRRSPNTLARACHDAVGLAPMKRLKQIRLSLARGLVLYSDLNMTEIALRIGYSRVHEFSRDYRKAYGHPPTTGRTIR